MRTESQDHKFFNFLNNISLSNNKESIEDYLIRFLNRHRIISDFENLTNTLDIKKNNWKDLFKNQVLISIHLSQVLINVLKSFWKISIEVMPLKGPLLASSLYGDIGKRHFGDLDLVIQKKDVSRVIQILNDLGFRQVHPRLYLTQRQWNYYFRWKKDIGLVNREQGVFVELHTGIYYHELLNKEKEQLFYEDLTEETLAGITVRCMNRDNTFLYLTYHGGQHMYFRLFWLRDVAEALKRWDLDHAKILRNAYDLGIERLLGVSLELAREFFEAKIPEEYHALLTNKRAIIKKLKKLCMKRILGPEELNFFGKLRKHYYIMSLKPGIKYKWVAFQSIFHRWYIRKFLGGN